jgi:hypothetical protein
LQGDLGGILLGVVEVLAVVPEAGAVDGAVDGHCAGPGSASSWREKKKKKELISD